MSFDSFTLRAVVKQLNSTIIDSEIISVVQNSPYDFVIGLRKNGKNMSLLISIHPVFARVHLTRHIYRKEKRWHFADFLQTHIGGGRITKIEQIGFDRIMRINVTPADNSLDNKLLIVELMGKHSNAILLNPLNNKILESIKHIDENMSRYRQVLPGSYYIMPPSQQQIDLFSVDLDTIRRILEQDQEPLWKKFLEEFQGMSPLLAKEIEERSLDRTAISVKSAIEQLMTMDYRPNVVFDNNDKLVVVYPIELIQFSEMPKKFFQDINEALEFFYDNKIEEERFRAEKNALIQSVKKKLQDLQDRHETLDKQLQFANQADVLKLKGDLLLLNLDSIKRGQKEAVLSNPYDPNSSAVVVELDERLSPAENAQRFFEEYKKAKKSRDVLEKLLQQNKRLMDYLSDVAYAIEIAEDLNGLESIRTKLERAKVLKPKPIEKKSREKPSLFRVFRSSDGFQILVGRNDMENDLLVKHESTKYDMWLHAKQVEGSHVLIKNPEKRQDIPQRTLLEAAIIAANFSKAKSSTIVPVDYTWAKYVSKPRGAKPGFVIYSREKTLFVSPADFEKIMLTLNRSESELH